LLCEANGTLFRNAYLSFAIVVSYSKHEHEHPIKMLIV